MRHGNFNRKVLISSVQLYAKNQCCYQWNKLIVNNYLCQMLRKFEHGWYCIVSQSHSLACAIKHSSLKCSERGHDEAACMNLSRFMSIIHCFVKAGFDKGNLISKWWQNINLITLLEKSCGFGQQNEVSQDSIQCQQLNFQACFV